MERAVSAIYGKKLYTVEDGLTQGYITCLLEDHKGYLWIGTLNGLNRFDGKKFENFIENPNDSFSVKGQYVDQILEDHEQRIWVLFNNGSMAVFDEKKRRFHSVILNGYEEHQERNYLKLFCDKGQFWIRQTKKIGRLFLTEQEEDHATWRAEISYLTVVDEDGKKPSRIKDLLFDGLDRLWLSSVQSVLIIDDVYRDTDTLYGRKFQLPNSTSSIDHFSLIPAQADSFWISSWQGDLLLMKGERVIHQKRYVDDYKHLGIIGLEKDENGIKWLQSVGNAPLYVENEDIFHETDFNCTVIYKTKDGTIWSGTDGFGLYRFSPTYSLFQNIGNEGYGIEPGQEMVAGPLTKSRNDELLMIKGSVLKLDYKTGRWISHKPWIDRLFNSNELKSVEAYLEDSRGRNWLASMGTIFCEEPDGSLSTYRGSKIEGESIGLFRTTVNGIIEDKNHKIWVINSGIIHGFDEKMKNFIRYRYHIENPPPREDGFNDFFDHSKNLWLATEMGLYLFDKAEKAIKRKWININGVKLEDVAFSALHQDNQDSTKIWVGTKNKGLFIYDLMQESWSALSQKNGLVNNTIYGIAQDALDRVWISTNAGIFYLHPDKKSWVNYRKENGIQGNEFNTRSFTQMANGNIFFGGMNGVTGVQPRDFQEMMHDYPIVINNFSYEKQAGNSREVRFIEDYSSGVELSFQDSRRIEIEFAWLNYNQPENHTYAYRLTQNGNWIDLRKKNNISFYSLNPGDYNLEIKATDWLGNTNQSSLLIPFTILSPWYQTGWAYLTYFLLSIGILTLIFRLRENRKRLELEAVMSRNEADRFKDLEQTKSRFFSNITHEFKTPLTLIIGPLEQLYTQTKSEANKKIIQTVRKNAADLLNLINQLLDVNKIEQGKMPVKYSKGDLALFTREICSKLGHLADSKHIKLTFYSNPKVVVTQFDSSKVERIVINLLSNALKFSPESTQVQVKLEQLEDAIILQVEDEGPGIPTEKLEAVFEQFYQVDGSDKRKYGGTGIGLALVKEYAELLGASVSVINNPVVGCTFRVVFPVPDTREAEKEEVDVTLSELPEQSNQATETNTVKTNKEGNPVVLIAEDNKDLNEYLKSCLSQYSVLQAYNGQQAWDMTQEHLPDLVLSDNMMPEITGVELCAKVKETDLTSHIPVLILTAKSAIESRVEGLSAGADDYLSKPFNQTELLVRIENLISLRKALREKYQSAMQSVKPSKTHETLSVRDKAFLEKAESLIEANLDNEEFDVNDFNEGLNLSRSQAHRKIKALTNLSVSVFIRSYRLKRAMEMMQKEGLIVKEAAYRVGFSRPSYFSKCFHDQFGIPPTKLFK